MNRMDAFIKLMEIKGYSPSTFQQYRSSLRLFNVLAKNADLGKLDDKTILNNVYRILVEKSTSSFIKSRLSARDYLFSNAISNTSNMFFT